MEAAEILRKKGWDCRVVSVPSWTLFDEQPAEYRNQVMCISDRKKGAILTAYVEAASTFGKLAAIDTRAALIVTLPSLVPTSRFDIVL